MGELCALADLERGVAELSDHALKTVRGPKLQCRPHGFNAAEMYRRGRAPEEVIDRRSGFHCEAEHVQRGCLSNTGCSNGASRNAARFDFPEIDLDVVRPSGERRIDQAIHSR